MFAKKKQFRRRTGTGDEEEGLEAEQEQGKNETKPPNRSDDGSNPSHSKKPPLRLAAPAGAGERKKPAVVAGLSRLSFEEEEGEEEEEVVVVKSKAKKKMGSGKPHEVRRTKDAEKLSGGKVPPPSNIMSKPGEYSKEKLAELMKNTNRLGGSFKPAEPNSEPKPTEPIIVLQGTIKPETTRISAFQESTTESFVQTTRTDVFESIHPGSSLGLEASSASDASKITESVPVTDDSTDMGSRGMGKFSESIRDVIHIPDSQSISAAKAKREKLRQARLAPDYISLQTPGGGSNREFLASLKEDGQDRGSSDEGEEDDEGRMVFVGLKGKDGGKKKDRMMTKRREETDWKDGVEDDSKSQQWRLDQTRIEKKREDMEEERNEEEEENEKWEEEQLKKAFGKNVQILLPEKKVIEEKESLKQAKVLQTKDENAYFSPFPATPSPIFKGQKFETTSISIQGENVMRDLRDRLQKLKEKHSVTKQDAEKTKSQLIDSAEAVLSLESKIEECNERYIYVQRFRDYVSLLCDFLKEKAPLIEVLEEMILKLCEEMSHGLMEKKRLDEQEEWEEVENEVFKILRTGGRGERKMAKDSKFGRDGNVGEEKVELDEFGRDLNLQKRLETKRRKDERESRRLRASSKRKSRKSEADLTSEKSLNISAPLAIEGESDSEQSDGETKSFDSKKLEIFKTADGIFLDAAEEYSQLKIVKSKVEDFKQRYPKLYTDAYLSLSIPSLFSPYVRLQFVKWNPLFDGHPFFDDMDWYKVLFDFGVNNGAADSNSVDPDAEIIPNLIEKIALPNLVHNVERCWNPSSVSSTQNCVASIKEVMIYLPEKNTNLLKLIDLVKSKLSQTIRNLQVASWPPGILTQVASGSYVSTRRFGKSLRLLRNLGFCSDIIERTALDELALKSLLNEKILPHLKSLIPTIHDAVDRTERLILALHRPWLASTLPSKSISIFQPFITYIDLLARAIEGRKVTAEDAFPEEILGLARRVRKIYVALNEYDRARALSKTFGFREAL